MDEQYVTYDDLAGYATMADLGYINERVDDLQMLADEGRDRFVHSNTRVDSIAETLNETVAACSEINRMNDEIAQIKEALIDIQDSLRRLGMDDMSQRLGDLKMLLA